MQRGDLPGYGRLFARLFKGGRELPPEALTAAIGELAPVLAGRPQGVFARLALVAGAFVEWGGSPVALADNSTACALMTMQLRLAFSDTWPVVAGGEPEPQPDQPPGMTVLMDRFRQNAGRLNMAEQQAATIAVSWFDVIHWVDLMITLMARREFRAAAPLLPEIGEAASALRDKVGRAHWLVGLSQVLDDEPLTVIDHTTGRGYRLTMSGVGDNYQLHTLLADRLIGDPAHGLLEALRPRSTWVEAASTGNPQLPTEDLIERRYRLFDATGAYIFPGGRPADIPRVNGARVIVLYPPQGNYGWHGGRTYEDMIPTLTLDQIMDQAEADTWRAHIAPARETDLFGTANQPQR